MNQQEPSEVSILQRGAVENAPVAVADLLTAYEKIQRALERPALPSVAENTAANS
jgi:hypothetical protein